MKNIQISILIAVKLLAKSTISCVGQENKNVNELKINQTEDKKSETKTMDKFEGFKQKNKFSEDMSTYYPGISDVNLLMRYTENINKSADEFKEISQKKHPTNKDYIDIIKIGLSRFNDVFDTEDKERICGYYEELMDMVGLESSEGLLNNFLYGFNLNVTKK